MVQSFPDRRLTDDDMPGLFTSADRVSLAGQQRYARLVMARSVLALGAALCGVAAWKVGRPGIDVLAILTMTILVVVLVLELYLRSSRPSDEWYEGRAVAESVKSLTWRYAVRAAPFTGANGAQDAYFLDELRELLSDVKIESGIGPAPRDAISKAVLDLRTLPVAMRQAVYIRDRIKDQESWYGSKAEFNRRRVEVWSRTLLMAEGVGILAAFAKVVGWIEFDLAGVVAAVIGVGATRLSLRQYSTNSRAYSFAAQELAIVRSRLERIDPNSPTADNDWAVEVSDAEEAISREHTMWRASRSRPE
ncbi:DUF4231 domain-containing protein [Kribbella endophytica]